MVPSIISRYVVREVLPPFCLTLLVFTFLMLLPPIMNQAEELIRIGVDARQVAEMLLLLVPQSLGVTIPMALLVGVLMALGRLSGDRETVAMQACGLSLFRILTPLLVLATATAAMPPRCARRGCRRTRRSWRRTRSSPFPSHASSSCCSARHSA